MIVAEIGIPSGFSASTYGISGHALLKRSEIEQTSVSLYFDEVLVAYIKVFMKIIDEGYIWFVFVALTLAFSFQITPADVCVDLTMTRNMMVASVKPVPCRAYEYYEPSMDNLLI